MPERIPQQQLYTSFPALPQTLTQLAEEIKQTGIPPTLLLLLDIRASQINGCAFCIDMHIHEARKQGEDQQRIDTLSVWREVPWFSEAERCALDACETLTRLPEGHLSDIQFTALQQHFSEQQIIAIISAIAVINSWNRVVSALALTPVPAPCHTTS
jgi:AhpD family alkylhydroperoxidase